MIISVQIMQIVNCCILLLESTFSGHGTMSVMKCRFLDFLTVLRSQFLAVDWCAAVWF